MGFNFSISSILGAISQFIYPQNANTRSPTSSHPISDLFDATTEAGRASLEALAHRAAQDRPTLPYLRDHINTQTPQGQAALRHIARLAAGLPELSIQGSSPTSQQKIINIENTIFQGDSVNTSALSAAPTPFQKPAQEQPQDSLKNPTFKSRTQKVAEFQGDVIIIGQNDAVNRQIVAGKSAKVRVTYLERPPQDVSSSSPVPIAPQNVANSPTLTAKKVTVQGNNLLVNTTAGRNNIAIAGESIKTGRKIMTVIGNSFADSTSVVAGDGAKIRIIF
jgi:hypothetical protein